MCARVFVVIDGQYCRANSWKDHEKERKEGRKESNLIAMSLFSRDLEIWLIGHFGNWCRDNDGKGE